jgi:hypothetical protein
MESREETTRQEYREEHIEEEELKYQERILESNWC